MDSKTQRIMAKRTKCEVFTRIVGYFRPVAQWNEGKTAEYYDRKVFNLKKCKIAS